ncbi:hypothetical protein HMY34_00760 [Thiothrix subterranea]|uniref:hypothetical protein n=1 Tax=Thiothrix subterranea TaxID=2735563 RepID=UPI00192C96EC|nr:hypothetical protein [Thiothrix subterranea]QQZ27400.1 hypothetical protein HMY34_00760 [Thiothrix subterranea]
MAALQAAAGSEVGFGSAQPTEKNRSLSGVEGNIIDGLFDALENTSPKTQKAA